VRVGLTTGVEHLNRSWDPAVEQVNGCNVFRTVLCRKRTMLRNFPRAYLLPEVRYPAQIWLTPRLQHHAEMVITREPKTGGMRMDAATTSAATLIPNSPASNRSENDLFSCPSSHIALRILGVSYPHHWVQDDRHRAEICQSESGPRCQYQFFAAIS